MALETGYRPASTAPRGPVHRCGDARAGRCPVTPYYFAIWATVHSPFPARVTIKGGEVAEVVGLDLP